MLPELLNGQLEEFGDVHEQLLIYILQYQCRRATSTVLLYHAETYVERLDMDETRPALRRHEICPRYCTMR
jgi:hypothetical protein